MDSKLQNPSSERPLTQFDVVNLPPPLAGQRGVVKLRAEATKMVQVVVIKSEQVLWFYESEVSRCGKITGHALNKYAKLISN